MEVSANIYKELTITEKNVLKHILNHPDAVIKQTCQEVANECNVSKTVVINLAQKIGLSGFNELKYTLRDTLPETQSSVQEDALINLDRTFMLDQTTEIEHIVKDILDAETIYIIARGSSKHLAAHLGHLLMTVEIKTIVVQEYNHYELLAKTMNSDDLMIAISLSGETSKVVETAKVASLNSRHLVSITAFSDNTLSRICDHNLYFIASETDTKENDTISRLPLLYIIETLVTEIHNHKEH